MQLDRLKPSLKYNNLVAETHSFFFVLIAVGANGSGKSNFFHGKIHPRPPF